MDGTPNKKIEGVIQHNGITGEISTGTIWGMNESNINLYHMEKIFVTQTEIQRLEVIENEEDG
ncbi:MAG: hypothetical protein WDM87_17025 [Terracidiphilus sp.]